MFKSENFLLTFCPLTPSLSPLGRGEGEGKFQIFLVSIISSILFIHLSIGLAWSSLGISDRIRELKPTHPFSKRIHALEVLGYDIVREEGKRKVFDSIKQSTPFLRGEKFELILYTVRKYRGNVNEMFLHLKVDSVVVGTKSVNIQRTQIGEMLKLSIPAWIPWSLIGNKATVKVKAESNAKTGLGTSIDLLKIPISGEVRQSKQNQCEPISDNLLADWKPSLPRLNKIAPTLILIPAKFDQAVASLDYGVYVVAPCSLRVNFKTGADASYFLDIARVKVLPNSPYRISYRIRTEEITSKSGPRLEIYDAERGSGYWVFTTKDLVGTNDWTKVESEFVTGRETKSIIVRMARFGRDISPFGNISGVAWFDCIILTRM